mmetsp:Transcript_47500/g.95018  ORF Transcript_47500/g.95018 Transcript_47500/m.95018 type:complete len:210 (+) Transcript_47500:203-832(+)
MRRPKRSKDLCWRCLTKMAPSFISEKIRSTRSHDTDSPFWISSIMRQMNSSGDIAIGTSLCTMRVRSSSRWYPKMEAKRWFMKIARRAPVIGSRLTCMMPVVGTAFHIWRSMPSTAFIDMPLSATGTLSKKAELCWRKFSSMRRPFIRLFRSVVGMFSKIAPTASSLHPASMVGMRSQGLLPPDDRCISPERYCVPSYDSGRSTLGHST